MWKRQIRSLAVFRPILLFIDPSKCHPRANEDPINWIERSDMGSELLFLTSRLNSSPGKPPWYCLYRMFAWDAAVIFWKSLIGEVWGQISENAGMDVLKDFWLILSAHIMIAGGLSYNSTICHVLYGQSWQLRDPDKSRQGSALHMNYVMQLIMTWPWQGHPLVLARSEYAKSA